jgi:hypothetical protein
MSPIMGGVEVAIHINPPTDENEIGKATWVSSKAAFNPFTRGP